MASSMIQVTEPGAAPAMIDWPGNRQRFAEPDTNQGVACVPSAANSVEVNLQALKDTDVLESLDFIFQFKGTPAAYDYTLKTSPMFPYNMVSNLDVPYQTGNFSAFKGDGHMLALINMLRARQEKFGGTYMLGQAADLATGYSAETLGTSSAAYAFAASTAKQFDFRLRVPISLWFDRFYDRDAAGKGIMYRDVDVTPLIMSSPGRSVLPSLSLRPLSGSKVDGAVTVDTGAGATHFGWTDSGSTVRIKRNGWRQPGDVRKLPPLFNWLHNYQVKRYAINSDKLSFTAPVRGQLLSVICRFFDPTLTGIAATIGDMIAVSGINKGVLSYGSGVAKFNDGPSDMQDRLLRQHGINPTRGVWIWDLFADTRSNVDAINTYSTAGVSLDFEFASAPGAGAYVDVCYEYLTQAQ